MTGDVFGCLVREVYLFTYLSMTDANILQLLGFIYLAFSMGAFFDRKILRNVLEGFVNNIALMVLSGMLVLSLGFIMVTFHNIWEWKVSLIITVLGWGSLLKGIVILLVPQWYCDIAKKLAKKDGLLQFAMIVCVLLGIIFIGMGNYVGTI